jgi:UDP-arabinose 4-epimerase
MAAPEAARTVLVTGGAGYIGSHVCKALAAAGYRPVTYDNLSEGHRWAVRWGPLERGNLSHTARLENAIRRYRPEAVIHLAGVIAAGESVSNPAKYYEINVAGTLSLLGVMRQQGIGRIVFSSSAAVYGEPQSTPMTEDHPLAPINPYGAGKLACERMIQDFSAAYGLRSIALRYFNAAGADPAGDIGEAHRIETHLVPLVLGAALGERPYVSVYGTDYPTRDGTCVRDYIHVSDLAAAHVLAMEFLDGQPGAHVFNLGTGSGATVAEVIAAARRVTGRSIDVRNQPRRTGDPAVLVADAALAKARLGWAPARTDLEQVISSAWRWHNRDKLNMGVSRYYETARSGINV